jgi:hypothetical protein
MADRDAVRALEALTPWDRPWFRDGLASLSASVADAARTFAADAWTLSQLAAAVPRCPGDEIGATPWTSFRQEVAVARQVSGQAAAAELRIAMRLTSVLPHTLRLLESGRISVLRARVFVTELEPLTDETAVQLDCELAERMATLAPWRIKDEVRRAGLALDPDSAAVRNAAATAERDVVLDPLPDGQACVAVTGPAVPLTRWYATLDARARALRQSGDARTLAALRFDLATAATPCLTHAPADSAAVGGATTDGATSAGATTDGAMIDGAAGRRPSGVEAAALDCRMSRPVQAVVVVPVETALGLSNEPAWLDGYGWMDAPSARLLLPDAELRELCVDGPTGQVLDLAARDVRPPPTPDGVRKALVDMVTGETVMTDVGWRVEPEHDPSEPLRELLGLRDRACDGPTQPRSRRATCDLDHDRPHPHGPTAAWNLVSRSRRTHQLKHYGWTATRSPVGTTWTSPAGQVVAVPAHVRPAPGVDADRCGGTGRTDRTAHTGRPTLLPDADELARVDADQLTPVTERPPVLPPPPERALAPAGPGQDEATPF